MEDYNKYLESNEFIAKVHRIVHTNAKRILSELGITTEEWDPDKKINICWDGPQQLSGTTTWVEEDPGLHTSEVYLIVKNILERNLLDNGVYSLIYTLAHELKHIEQIKRGIRYADYTKPQVDMTTYKEQEIEKEAVEFGMGYVERLKNKVH